MFIYYLYQGIKKNGTVTQQVKRTLLRFINKCCVSRAKQVSAARHICESTHASCHRLRERAECANTLGSHGFKSICTKQIQGIDNLETYGIQDSQIFQFGTVFFRNIKISILWKGDSVADPLPSGPSSRVRRGPQRHLGWGRRSRRESKGSDTHSAPPR